MFTLKLYTDASTMLVEAAGFHIRSYGEYAKIITAHGPTGEDRVFLVGDFTDVELPMDDMPPPYDRAIIENAAGKTSEIIQPPPRHDPLKEAQQRYADRLSGSHHPV